MNYRVSLFLKPRPYRLFCYALLCSWFFATPGQGATDNAVEQRLNEVYLRLRHMLTPADKEALKQEELDWLKRRERFSSGGSQWIELTEERIRELEARLSGKSPSPPLQQMANDAASPDDQYVVAGNESSGNGPSRDIDLKTRAGKTLLTLGSAAQFGFKANWSADSKHLIVILPGRFNGAENDTMVLAERVDGEWKTVDFGMPGASEIRFLTWLSDDTARLQGDKKAFTMQFPKPTTFLVRLSRFSTSRSKPIREARKSRWRRATREEAT
jgi:hypothetical protein